MTDPKAHNVLVETLGSALRYGGSALADVPDLLKQVLQEEAWRSFLTRRGDLVTHHRFESFVITPPTAGLGATMDLIERIAGTDDPELLTLLRKARMGKPGRPKGEGRNPLDSYGLSAQGESADYTAARLASEAPEEFEAVRRGEKSIHAAAVAAGIRKRRIAVRLDDPASAVRSLKSNSSPEFWAELRRLVIEDS